MADASYILGTNEYVVVELERSALSATFTASNWDYELCLVAIGDAFDESTETWVDAVYELATDAAGQTHHTVKALLAGTTPLTAVAGTFTAFVRMTTTAGETETPTLLRAAGKVTVV